MKCFATALTCVHAFSRPLAQGSTLPGGPGHWYLHIFHLPGGEVKSYLAKMCRYQWGPGGGWFRIDPLKSPKSPLDKNRF